MPPARTLPDAYDNLQYFGLDPADKSTFDLYVSSRDTYLGEPKSGPIVRMRRELDRALDGRRAGKLFLSGHKGTGKTSELNRLRADYEKTAEVLSIRIQAEESESAGLLADLNARDLLYLILGEVIERLEHFSGLAKLTKDPEAAAALQLLARNLPGVKVDGPVEFNVFGVIKAKLGLDRDFKARLREAADVRRNDLMLVLNRALQALASLVSRPVIAIVDGLDHLRISGSSDAKAGLFNEDLSLLLAPECIVVYTVPINVHYDPGFAALHQQRFRYTLGCIKLWQGPRDRTPFEPGWAFIRELVSRRADAALFAPGVIERAISFSGGSFEQILRLLANAADSADYQNLAQASDVHLEAAIKEVRADFVLLCGSWDHVRRLARVHQQHRIEVSAGDLEYLPIMAVLQQVNAAPWHVVNPVFIDYVLETLGEIESA